MKLKASVVGAFDAGGSWSIDFPEFEGFKLYIVLKGETWVSIEGDRTKYHLKAGDCFLNTSGRSSVVSRDPLVKRSVKIDTLVKNIKNGIITVNGGGDLFSIGISFQFEGHLPKIMFSRLPPVIHVPGHLDQAAVLRWSLELFSAEYEGQNVGRSLILNHLTPIMLLQILRVYLPSVKNEKNWLVALCDPRLSKAIEEMHTDYKKAWSLDSLAKVAGLSRSGFALNFKKQVGIPPMDYLTNWRIQIACELLQVGEKGISEIAHAVGYESDSAFSDAFKRIIKCRPGFYQKNYGSSKFILGNGK